MTAPRRPDRRPAALRGVRLPLPRQRGGPHRVRTRYRRRAKHPQRWMEEA